MSWEATVQILVKIAAIKSGYHQRLADAEAYLTDTGNVAIAQSHLAVIGEMTSKSICSEFDGRHMLARLIGLVSGR